MYRYQRRDRHHDGSILNQEEVTRAYNKSLSESRNAPSTLFQDNSHLPARVTQSQPTYSNSKYARLTCLNCTQVGHIARNCPNDRAPQEIIDRLHHTSHRLFSGIPRISTQPRRFPVTKTPCAHIVEGNYEVGNYNMERFLAQDDAEFLGQGIKAIDLNHSDLTSDDRHVAGTENAQDHISMRFVQTIQLSSIQATPTARVKQQSGATYRPKTHYSLARSQVPAPTNSASINKEKAARSECVQSTEEISTIVEKLARHGKRGGPNHQTNASVQVAASKGENEAGNSVSIGTNGAAKVIALAAKEEVENASLRLDDRSSAPSSSSKTNSKSTQSVTCDCAPVSNDPE